MRTKAIMTTIVLGLTSLATPALAQQSGGGLGGVLDTLGGLLGGGSRTLHGSVVVSDGNTIVLRTDDRSTYRVDVASLDPSSRTNLTPGQTVTVDTSGVDQQSVASVRPGDAVTVTGTPAGEGGKFVAQSLRSDR